MFSKIERLKRKAKKYYMKYNRILDGMDCGVTLALQISSRLSIARTNFNNTLDELAKIDSQCTTKRL
jgi:hypothetical protein